MTEQRLEPPRVASVEALVEGESTVLGHIPGRSRSERWTRIAAYTALTAIALLYFVPFLWTVSTSLKTLPDSANFTFIPHPWTTQAYVDVWTKYDFARYIENSAGLSLAITLITLFLAGLGGYAFARLRFPGREILFFLVLGTL